MTRYKCPHQQPKKQPRLKRTRTRRMLREPFWLPMSCEGCRKEGRFLFVGVGAARAQLPGSNERSQCLLHARARPRCILARQSANPSGFSISVSRASPLSYNNRRGQAPSSISRIILFALACDRELQSTGEIHPLRILRRRQPVALCNTSRRTHIRSVGNNVKGSMSELFISFVILVTQSRDGNTFVIRVLDEGEDL